MQAVFLTDLLFWCGDDYGCVKSERRLDLELGQHADGPA